MDGQKQLKAASVLLIGAGGLGSPLGLYLAAAGVGRLGLVDFDVVDFSNLQRQVLHGTADVGRPKLHSAKDKLQAINPEVQARSLRNAPDVRQRARHLQAVRHHHRRHRQFPDALPGQRRLRAAEEAERLRQHLPLRRPGVGVRTAGTGPCYRCLYPEPPPPGEVPSCAEGGVLGILPGLVGCIQATEAVKLILGTGRAAHRPAAALRRPADELSGIQGPPQSEVPDLRRQPDHQRSSSTTSSSAASAARKRRRRRSSCRRDHRRGTETAPRQRREGVHPRRAQSGGISDLQDPRQHAAAACRRCRSASANWTRTARWSSTARAACAAPRRSSS